MHSMQRVKKTACGLLAAVLLAGGSGCAGDTSWVYEYEGIRPTPGVYIAYLVTASSNAETKIAEQHENDETFTAPTHKELMKMTVEDTPAEEWIAGEAQRLLREYLAVEKQFADRGLALTEAEEQYCKSTAATTFAGNKEFYEKNGIGEVSLRGQLENRVKREAIFRAIYGAGGEQAVSEQQLSERFQQEYLKAEMMLFLKTTDRVDAVKTEAEGYLARLQAGEALEQLVYEQEQAAAGENAASVEKPQPGERTVIFSRADAGNGYYSNELVEGAFAAAVGEPVLLEDANFFYILRRQDILENQLDLETYRQQLLSEMKSDEFSALVAEWAAAVVPAENEAALQAYRASKLKID